MKCSFFHHGTWYLLIASLLSTGCSIRYLTHVSKGQLQINKKRESIEKALVSGKLSPEQVQKLKLVEDVRQFALNELKLTSTDSYTQYVALDRNHVAYNLVVCPKDSLIPMSWWFPFVGSVDYLGFFNLEYAKETQKDYIDDGYDTYLRGVSAYSTLGWFKDPIFSTMLQYEDHSLANVIIHELTHATIYKKGDTFFNEGVATFVGNQGALNFLEKKYGKKSIAYQSATDDKHDDLIFSQFMKESRESLERFYKGVVLDRDRDRDREFDKIKNNFQKIKPKFKTRSYDFFETLPLNNAIIIAYGQYLQDLTLFEKLWEKNHRDLPKTIVELKALESHNDPMSVLRK